MPREAVRMVEAGSQDPKFRAVSALASTTGSFVRKSKLLLLSILSQEVLEIVREARMFQQI